MNSTEQEINTLLAMLNTEQREAYEEIKNNDFEGYYYIDGMPGVGKTFLAGVIGRIILLEDPSMSIAAVAPSHKAKQVLSDSLKFNAQTIHSYCGFVMEGSESIELDAEGHMKQVREPSECDILIIDETSMVESFLFEEAIKTAPLVIALGDENQLPVINGESSDLDPFQKFELTEQMRQENVNKELYKTILNLRNSIKNNEPIKKFEYDESFEKVSTKIELAELYLTDKIDVIGCFTNAAVDAYNEYIHYHLYKRKTIEETDTVILQAPLIVTEEVGKQYQSEIVKNNGDLVTINKILLKMTGIRVVSITEVPDEEFFLVEPSMYNRNNKTGNTFLYDTFLNHFDNMKWRIFRDAIMKAKLPYAMTVHKLQGSSYKNIGIDADDIIKNSRSTESLLRLLYVGTSRAKTKCYLKKQ